VSASSTAWRTTIRRAAATAKRYQDVQEVVDQGISVLTSINLEYIEEQQEFVRTVTGATPKDTVPQSFVVSADDVVVVDAPPEAVLEERDGEGLTLHAGLAQQLSQLRERALLLTADVVDRQLEAYLELHGIEASGGTQERILVCMTPRADATAMGPGSRGSAGDGHPGLQWRGWSTSGRRSTHEARGRCRCDSVRMCASGR
jgi:K+-sensing histidine kinase KdpD